MKSMEILSAHRSWIHANLMFENFERTIQPLKTEQDSKNFFVSIPGTYMLLWYSLLFCTCEYLKEINAIPDDISSDLDSIYDSLRRFRNAVFHVQDKYYSPKLIEIMKDKDSVFKIRRIHNELGNFFLEYINNNQLS